jgi:hypothetical protein
MDQLDGAGGWPGLSGLELIDTETAARVSLQQFPLKRERRRVPQVPVFGTWVLGSNFLFLGIFVPRSLLFRELAKDRTGA